MCVVVVVGGPFEPLGPCRGLCVGTEGGAVQGCGDRGTLVKGPSRACQGLVKGLSRACQGVVKGLSRAMSSAPLRPRLRGGTAEGDNRSRRDSGWQSVAQHKCANSMPRYVKVQSVFALK